MPPTLLDTDTLSEIIKGRHALIDQRALLYLAQYGRFTFSIITRFEIPRGLKARNATAQLAAFDLRCQSNDILPLSDPIIVQAAEFYAHLKQQGQLVGDADLLIAATAMVHGLVLATNNLAHYSRIPGLTLISWAAP